MVKDKARFTSAILSLSLVILTGCSPSHTPTSGNRSVSTANAPTNITVPNGTASNVANGTSSRAGALAALDATPRFYVVTETVKTQHEDISYPQVHGLSDSAIAEKINKILKDAATPASNGNSSDNQAASQPSQLDAWYTILLNRGGILEVMYSSYEYMEGAAHGMPGRTVVIVNMKDGTEYHIPDLFKPGSPYLTRLSDAVRQQDTSHLLDTFQPFTGVTNSDGFYLTDNTLHVYFEPYEWTAYAVGFPEFTVPLAKLTDVINAQSALWNALQSPAAIAKASDESTNLSVIHSKNYVPLFPYQSEAPDGIGNTLYAWDARASFSTNALVQKVFFFWNGKYLGTDTLKAHGPVIQMTPVGKAAIAVTYSTNDVGGLTITYRWDGTKIVADKGFPSTYKEWSNH